MNFRYDINGLRAIAVIAVVLFHFNPTWVPGGFTGVDVFFVISGFLMTKIIVNGLENNSFSLINFYVARANRIIPTLAVLCLFLLIFGWFYLPPFDYGALGKHVASSMGFLSNIIYWRESGYFDAASQGKWLLHTWSLSVEWQFYMLYPIGLLILHKFLPLKHIKKIIVSSAAISFIFCVIAISKWTSASYFLLPTRAWEMLLGGVAFLYPISLKENYKVWVERLGIALILLSYAFISEDNLWPGYLALIPTMGAYLIILANRCDSAFTNNVVFQKIGLWSYSIYLWHWPVVVAIYYFSLTEQWIYIGMVVSILLGYISFALIEQRNLSVSNLYYLKQLPYAGLIGFAIWVYQSDGALLRMPLVKQQLHKEVMKAQKDWDYPVSNLEISGLSLRYIKGTSKKNILFLGASHIEQTYPYVQEHHKEYNIYYLTQGGCFVTRSTKPFSGDCQIQRYQKIFAQIHFEKVVTSFYCFDCGMPHPKLIEQIHKEATQRIFEYDQFLKFIKSKTKDVFLILGEPKGDEFNPKLATQFNLSNQVETDKIRNQYKMHNDALKQLTELSGITIIDPISHLCDEHCYTRDKSNKFFYRDANHMRPWYAKKHLTYLDVIFQ